MSIVYDYLKQIQDKKEPVKEVLPEKPKIRPRGWLKIFFAILLCLGIGFAIYQFAPRTVRSMVNYSQGPADDVTGNLPLMRSTEPSLVLEGIIYNPAQPFAIINGKMLEPKGRVGDFEISKISPDSVTLRNTKDNTMLDLRL